MAGVLTPSSFLPSGFSAGRAARAFSGLPSRMRVTGELGRKTVDLPTGISTAGAMLTREHSPVVEGAWRAGAAAGAGSFAAVALPACTVAPGAGKVRPAASAMLAMAMAMAREGDDISILPVWYCCG